MAQTPDAGGGRAMAAARALPFLPGLVLVLALAGCGDGGKQADLAACRLDAMRLHPNEDGTTFPTDQAIAYVATCMRDKGHAFDKTLASCPAGAYRPELDVKCYAANSAMGRVKAG